MIYHNQFTVAKEIKPVFIECYFCENKFNINDIEVEINFGQYQAYCGKCDN